MRESHGIGTGGRPGAAHLVEQRSVGIGERAVVGLHLHAGQAAVLYLYELQALALHHNLTRPGVGDGQIAVEAAHLVAAQRTDEWKNLAGEEVGETNAESRLFLSVEVEAEHVVVGGGSPDAVDDSRTFHLGYYELVVFLAQVRVFARKSVVVAPCPVVA